MLLGTLGAHLKGNMLAGKAVTESVNWVIQAREGMIKAGHDF